jgi:phage-related protein/predicted XRE-type DNA-binding protein
MKPISFLGNSLECLREFPENARQDAGYVLDQVQRGKQPSDFKPMATVGKGVEELRVWDDAGTYRVIYLARLKEAVYVLHAFQKKTRATSKQDIEMAKSRYTELMRGTQMKKRGNTYASVWDALADTPEQAANLQARADLMRQIAELIQAEGWKQVEAAERCGVTQPRINDLLRGRVSRFSLDALVNIATALGRRVSVELEVA